MFPIRDHNPSLGTPIVTYALIASNVVVFLGYAGLFDDQARLVAFFDRWALIPARLAAGEGYATLVTSMFLHGGLLHIAGNMLFLWIFGDNLEEALRARAASSLFYFACGIAAALAQALPDPGSTVPMVGASGAVAGVMGGYLLLFPRARVDVLDHPDHHHPGDHPARLADARALVRDPGLQRLCELRPRRGRRRPSRPCRRLRGRGGVHPARLAPPRRPRLLAPHPRPPAAPPDARAQRATSIPTVRRRR